MRTIARLIADALQTVKGKGFVDQALEEFIAIESDLCQKVDTALARGLYEFNFDPGLSTLFGSGPYHLPLDYLRTSGSSGATGVTRSAWYLYPAPAFPAGQPMPLVPIDLAEFDRLPILNAQGLPSTLATDMGGPLTNRIVRQTTANLTAASTAGAVVDATGIVNGMAVAGEGIVPGTTVQIAGLATATLPTASVFFGVAPVAYIYPAPVGPYPAKIRYQRMMPAQFDTAQYPWFPDEGYLMDELCARMAGYTGDTRRLEFMASAGKKLAPYLNLADDKTNRSQNVQLDARNFGSGYGRRRKDTKVAGWGQT